MYTLVIRTTQLSNYINSTYSELKSDQIETANKINEISSSLKSTQSDLSNQLAELKATTSSDFSGIIENSVNSVITIIFSHASFKKIKRKKIIKNMVV